MQTIVTTGFDRFNAQAPPKDGMAIDIEGSILFASRRNTLCFAAQKYSKSGRSSKRKYRDLRPRP